MDSGYSVLMAVYASEDPGFFRESIASMLCQTVPTDDFVLVCDGPLTQALEAVIAGQPALRVIRLPEHRGLAAALNTGLRHCRYELVARMDSDDISHPQRCQRQLARFREKPELAVLSGTVAEFQNDPSQITGWRTLPSGHLDICRFSRKRSPFNHPAVMYRKSAVLAAGGYGEGYPYFEDYDLWIRMLQAGFRGENLAEPLLFMRTGSGMYRRRRGMAYSLGILRFHWALRWKGWSNGADYLCAALPHALVCLLPLPMVQQVYQVLHRVGEAL